MKGKTPMTHKAAARITSSTAKTGPVTKKSFAARATSAAAKNVTKGKVTGKK